METNITLINSIQLSQFSPIRVNVFCSNVFAPLHSLQNTLAHFMVIENFLKYIRKAVNAGMSYERKICIDQMCRSRYVLFLVIIHMVKNFKSEKFFFVFF